MSLVRETSALSLIVYVNGEYIGAGDAKVSVFDRGLIYGDGAFEGIRIDDGKIFRLREHIQRLFTSLQYLRIAMRMGA